MSLNIAETTEDAPEESPRAQAQDRIAEALAELSDVTDTPEGLQACASFSPAEVDFDSDAWISRLSDVQGWLRFDDDLSNTDLGAFTRSLAKNLNFVPETQGIDESNGATGLTTEALERLAERAERAARLKDEFIAELNADGGTQASATASWSDQWETEGDDEDVSPEPVTAKADVWHIFQLTKKKLNLTPSYQRGDVWRTGDRQKLIESILRGIPLPSIILLRKGGAVPDDVVDGKQRLTAILRFVGKHPEALARVIEADKAKPEARLREKFETDYPQFRLAWKSYMGEPLTAKLEDDYYFPFRLRNDKNGVLVGKDLEPLRGKYYTQIKGRTIHVADQEVTVEELFEGAPDYKVPVIEYTKASQRQIHEVFNLYNKQGMHLNAEEIRNAVFHDVELTRAILVAAGDASRRARIEDITPSLVNVPGVAELGKTLADYGFGAARYRRTKVLGWIIAVLVNDSGDKLLPSTARHTDDLLKRVQDDNSHPLRVSSRLADLFGLVTQAASLHATYDELWPEKFRGDGKSSRWQDLQLVGSLVGIAIATAGAPDDIEERIEANAEAIRDAALNEWTRPEKTQTRTQWDFIARIAAGVVEKLGIDITSASEAIRSRFGSSGVESLLLSRIPARGA
ncbi:DUF262 domain-containing protein [Microbacterium jiangjiandongii]|uniref:DUF262 domain-containing protein n=1 Tax=Microbacterium jiangjiandongii TaxID=3049071 RepID=UPI00214AC3E9|nr:DUF262 domain-containing protein [Microbacterium sp. zg.Y843]MCR2816580.1 DUF262 domain-containing protein [Microbacterium sp. zg.Y843]